MYVCTYKCTRHKNPGFFMYKKDIGTFALHILVVSSTLNFQSIAAY